MFAEVGVHERVPVVDRERDAARIQKRLDARKQSEPDILLPFVHVTCVDLLHVDEHHHVVHARFLAKRKQLWQLDLVVKPRVATEAEAIAKRVGHEILQNV
ncbi:hypothetical protein SDC9_137138 [bioreactor metagenome]|uniref:Uncharacterized protein n=1 Tax=bioreactor metagenome TaxID=1076179 RepID=A0A645DNA7_9ZZZZ